jgi:excisionase family DNA binding protein
MNNDEHRLLTVNETAELLRVSPPTVRRLIREDLVPAVQLAPGHAVRIPRRGLEQLLDEAQQPAAAGGSRG